MLIYRLAFIWKGSIASLNNQNCKQCSGCGPISYNHYHHQSSVPALGTGKLSPGAWFIYFFNLAWVGLLQIPLGGAIFCLHDLRRARGGWCSSLRYCYKFKSLMPNGAAASVKLENCSKFAQSGVYWIVDTGGDEGGAAGQLPAGVTQLVSHSANTHPVLSRRSVYQPGRLIISAAEHSRGHVSVCFHSASPSRRQIAIISYFWGQLPIALVYFNMTRETDAGCSWAQVQSDKEVGVGF